VILSLSNTDFSCVDLGVNMITFFAEDASGNESSSDVEVTVTDTMKPELKARSGIILALDGSGEATLSVSAIDEGSTDNCGLVEQVLSQTNFGKNESGFNAIVYTIKDASGNTVNQEIVVFVDVLLSALVTKKSELILRIYPNPAGQFITLDFDSRIEERQIEIRITDVSGKEMPWVRILGLEEKRIILDTSKLTNGLYILRLTILEEVIIKKFTIMT